MNLTATQLWKLLESLATVFVVLGQYREGYEHFVGMQTRVVASEVVDLGVLDRLNHGLWDELCLVVDAGKMLGDVEKQGCATTKE